VFLARLRRCLNVFREALRRKLKMALFVILSFAAMC